MENEKDGLARDLARLKAEILDEITGENTLPPTERLEEDIEAILEGVHSLSSFNPVSRQEACLQDGAEATVEVGGMIFTSASLCRFIEGAQACIIMAATLGPRIESKMQILQMTDMSKAYLFDLACLYYLEMRLDRWENELRAQLKSKNLHLSGRFSPGYGDLSLEHQPEILKYLDAQKRIGIELTKNNLMIPQKSVTAILGVSCDPFKRTYSRCDACLRRESCKKRGGKHCEFHG